MKTKNGKKPLSAKAPRPAINVDDVFSNKLSIPEEILKDMQSKGYEPRWLDGKKLMENGGYHDKDWTVYQRPEGVSTGTLGFKVGNDPDRIVRRGSLILGYKTKEQAANHRAFLQQRAERYKTTFDKNEAAKLKQQIKDADLDVQIESGFDEEDSD